MPLQRAAATILLAPCKCHRQEWPHRRPATKVNFCKSDNRHVEHAPYTESAFNLKDEIVANQFQSLVPAACPVRVTLLPMKGRALVATRHIQVGEEVLWEEPIAWTLNPEHQLSRCASCARAATEDMPLKPCSRCHASFHLCSNCETHPCCNEVAALSRNRRNLPTAQALLALQVALIVYQGSEVGNLVEHLCWHRCPIASELRVFEGMFRPSFESLIHGCAVRCMCNQFTFRTTGGDALGGALFLVSSMANHDCNPNVEMRFSPTEPTKMSFVARRTIESGEEICGSYIEVKLPRSERQRLLNDWKFQCACSRCNRAMLPNGDERTLFGVRCTSCGSVFAEAEGESCTCGGDDPEARKAILEDAYQVRQRAHTMIRDSIVLDRQIVGRSQPCGMSTWKTYAMFESIDQQLQRNLDAFRSVLSHLHFEILFTMRLLLECRRRHGGMENCKALHKDLSDMALERTAWMSGDRTL